MYDDLMALLKANHGWDVEPSALPYKPTIEKALADGRSPDDIASALTKQAERKQGPPRGHAAYGDPDGEWAYRLRWTFGSSSKFGALETEQALGYQPQDEPFRGKAGARTAEDLATLTSLGWAWDGRSQFLDLSTPEGQAEYDRRAAFARANFPPSWEDVDRYLYEMLVIIGRLPSTIPPFGVRVSEPHALVYGLNRQKWLDNQWAAKEQLPPRWFPDGRPNPNNPDNKGFDK